MHRGTLANGPGVPAGVSFDVRERCVAAKPHGAEKTTAAERFGATISTPRGRPQVTGGRANFFFNLKEIN
jgi:hypothetical protein